MLSVRNVQQDLEESASSFEPSLTQITDFRRRSEEEEKFFKSEGHPCGWLRLGNSMQIIASKRKGNYMGAPDICP